MQEEWSAVAKAINQRVAELGWRQRDLAARSGVSLAIVRELQQNQIHRRRSSRTLESLSRALGWHPEHLKAVMEGRRPPASDDAAETDSVPARLDAIEHQIRRLTTEMQRLTDRITKASSNDSGDTR